jgi:hypothetical protein
MVTLLIIALVTAQRTTRCMGSINRLHLPPTWGVNLVFELVENSH